jgi:hypothetical protein
MNLLVIEKFVCQPIRACGRGNGLAACSLFFPFFGKGNI